MKSVLSFMSVLCVVTLVALAGCGADNAIGEACSGQGSTDDCVDGAICTTEAGRNLCRKICTTEADCSDQPGTGCEVVMGTTTKACHL